MTINLRDTQAKRRPVFCDLEITIQLGSPEPVTSARSFWHQPFETKPEIAESFTQAFLVAGWLAYEVNRVISSH